MLKRGKRSKNPKQYNMVLAITILILILAILLIQKNITGLAGYGVASGSAPNTPTLNAPLNASTITTNPYLRPISITVNDAEADSMNVSIYGDNTTASSLLYFAQNVANGTTLLYNFTSMPVGAIYPSGCTELVRYWNFDKYQSDLTA